MLAQAPLVVICDDEEEVRETVGEYLTRRGCQVTLAANGADLDRVLDEQPETQVVLLDIAMPGEDGLAVLRRLRVQRRVAVIMLTAAGEPLDRIVGLELGADDYLSKPPDLRELDARIRAVLRRPFHREDDRAIEPASEPPAQALKVGPFTLDVSGARLIDERGEEIPLTAMEFRLLRVFVDNRGRVMTREQLLSRARGDGREPLDRAIDNMVSRLRRKLEHGAPHQRLIRTVRGLGYVFDPDGT
ncbi:MAG: response regulator transcription factor [Devosia sp.]